MGNWRRICFSHYLTRTLFQNLKLMHLKLIRGKARDILILERVIDFSTTGSAGLRRHNNGRKQVSFSAFIFRWLPWCYTPRLSPEYSSVMWKKKPIISNTGCFFCFNSTVSCTYSFILNVFVNKKFHIYGWIW